MEYTERKEGLKKQSKQKYGNPSPKNGAQKKTRNKRGLGSVFVRIYVVKTSENGSGNEFHRSIQRTY